MRTGWTLLAALLLVGAPDAMAQEKAGEGRTGPYLGVQPGLKDNAPRKEDVRSRGAVRVLTWVGFQMIGQGGRVFIQCTEPPVYSMVPAAPDEVVIEFAETRLHTSNDGRALDTTWFPTAVASVDAEQFAGNLTRVTIRLREVVGYDMRQEGNYLFLDFRPPTGAVVPQAPPPPEPSTPE